MADKCNLCNKEYEEEEKNKVWTIKTGSCHVKCFSKFLNKENGKENE